MIKYLFSITLFAVCTSIAYAQMPGGNGAMQAPSITGKITATVIDSTTNTSVAFATVSVAKSGSDKIINGAVADEKGNVKITGLKPGDYRIIISFLGYKTKTIDPITLSPQKPDFKLAKITLTPNNTVLSGVTIDAQAAVIENKIDKLVYNADKDATSASGDATEILKKVPMVSVDLDGNVALRGNSSVRVFINGKPSNLTAGSASDALKMIPADQIKTVEVITNPSAKYDGEGSGGIINIITKKKDLEGTNGSVNASAGTRQNFTNASLNVRKGRLSISSTIGGNWSWKRIGTNNFFRADTLNDMVRTLNQEGRTAIIRNGGRGTFGVDYDINKYNNVSSNIAVNGMVFNRDGMQNSVFTDTDTTLAYTRSSKDFNTRMGLDFDANYKRTFEQKDKEWTVSFLVNQNIGNAISSYVLTPTNESSDGKNKNINTELTGQTDFIQPITEKLKLETGLKAISRNITSDYNYQQTAGVQQNVFTYKQDVYAAYVSTTAQVTKGLTLLAGIRGEQTRIGGAFTNGTAAFANNYTNILPSITISKSLKKLQTIKASFSQRIQRPGQRFLNPFTENSDPRNISVGNPYLAPEISNLYELGYSSFVKSSSINLSVFHRHTTAVIEGFLQVDTAGVSRTVFQNVSTINSYGLNAFGSISPVNKLTIRGSVNLYYDFINSAISTLSNQGVNYMVNAMATYSFSKGLIVEAVGFINSPRITLQGTTPSFSMVTFGLRKEILKKKGSIGLTANNPFTRDRIFKNALNGTNFYQESQFAIPFRSFGISFSWQFGKLDFGQNGGGRRKKGINNDDLKQGGDGSGGM